jgi:hypothetical protein
VTETSVREQAVRCSAWARAESLDPIGSIGSYQGFLLVEVPLPWPRDVGLVAELEELAGSATDKGFRVQALVPSSRAPERRVILYSYRSEPGWFDGMVRRSTVIDAEQLRGALSILLDRPPEPGRDLLVCTHGRRDVCCGSSGTELALQLANGDLPAGLSLWRTSHTGGHRFAPTFLLLPDATGWAFADPSLVHRVAERSVPFATVAPHYRGCAGLEGPLVQAVDREVLSLEGWELMDRPRRGFTTGEADADGRRVVRFEVADGHGGVDAWEALVGPGRVLPVPDCGKPLSEAKKSETEWVVSELQQI